MDEAKRDLFFVILFLLGLAIIWNFTGGPSRPSATSGPLLNQPLEKHRAEIMRGTKTITGESPSPNLTKESAYKYKAILMSGSGAKNSDPREEYVEMRYSSNKGLLNVSQWSLEGSSGINIKFGQGASLAYPAQINQQSDIFLKPGGKAYIITGESPIGTSFQLNKCSGYLGQFQNFTPNLPKQCPRPRDENPPANLGGECLDYISSLPACEMPVRNMPTNLSTSCRDYISQKINYGACVQSHKDDSNFYESEWRIYLGKNKEMWKNGMETIILRDENDSIVDWMSY